MKNLNSQITIELGIEYNCYPLPSVRTAGGKVYIKKKESVKNINFDYKIYNLEYIIFDAFVHSNTKAKRKQN